MFKFYQILQITVLRSRIIPVILIKDGYVVKTVKFLNPKYIGDPINIVRIFNEKEADELTVFDIGINQGDKINFNIIQNIASSARMPLTYGGGINELSQVEMIFSTGIEKISISRYFLKNPQFCTEIANKFGTQSISVTFDVNKTSDERLLINSELECGYKKLQELIIMANERGAGEIIINCVHMDGTEGGYDESLLSRIYETSTAPITIVGGASSLENILSISKKYPIIGLGVGSLFVYKGKNKAVLINYPSEKQRNPYA